MTVLAPMGKLSWKVAAPVVIGLLTIAVGIWFIPTRDYYFEQRLVKYTLNGLCTFSALVIAGMLIAWTIRDDKAR